MTISILWTNSILYLLMRCAKFDWYLAQCFWTRSKTCKKFTDKQTDGQRDAGQKVVRKVHLSFLMKWAIKTFRFWLREFKWASLNELRYKNFNTWQFVLSKLEIIFLPNLQDSVKTALAGFQYSKCKLIFREKADVCTCISSSKRSASFSHELGLFCRNRFVYVDFQRFSNIFTILTLSDKFIIWQ